MAPARQLYHLHADWDHSPAGYITDYFIFVVSLVVCVLAYLQRRKVKDEIVRRALLVFMVGNGLFGVTFLFGGVAHNMLDDTAHPVIGFTWGSANSAWMFPWTLAVLLTNISFALVCAVPFALIANSGPLLWMQYGMLVMGCLEGIIELVIMIAEKPEISGVYALFLSMLFMFIGAIASLTFAVMRRSLGYVLQMFGFIVMIVGSLIPLLRPDACSSHFDHPDCPFSASFNHNAWYHVLLIVGQILYSIGVFLYATTAAQTGADKGGEVEATTYGA